MTSLMTEAFVDVGMTYAAYVTCVPVNAVQLAILPQ